jgi:hypothetical protein
LTVTCVNDAPDAVDDSYTTNQDTADRRRTGVLANDTDPDGDTLTVTANTNPAHGTVTVNANGSFTYTPNAATAARLLHVHGQRRHGGTDTGDGQHHGRCGRQRPPDAVDDATRPPRTPR